MSFVRTLAGDLAPEALGGCYSHEHVILDASYATQIFPEQCLNSVENGVKELSGLRDLGVRHLVEATPCGMGRNVRKLREIARRSGVGMVATTGFAA
ncbi:MAG: hypothetical protein HC904_09595 [Blastochloris sp.]|nr:hypothetical protein [Blastochloris sp.]